MNRKHVVAFALVLAPLPALPAEPAPSDASSAAVATLKSSLPSKQGFTVDLVHMTDAGVACIAYRVNNDMGGKTRAQAVVEGQTVLRSTSRNSKFANAWNSKCASLSEGGQNPFSP
jgi:hypothetical protein